MASRPSRVAAAKLKSYVEDSEEELNGVVSDESGDESFDEDEDPDKIEVPGGGSNLQDALKLAQTVKPEPGFASSSKHLDMGFTKNNIGINYTSANSTAIKQEPSSSNSGFDIRKMFNLPEGTTVRPNMKPQSRSTPTPVINPLGGLSAQATQLPSMNFGLPPDLAQMLAKPIDMMDPYGANALMRLYTALLSGNLNPQLQRRDATSMPPPLMRPPGSIPIGAPQLINMWGSGGYNNKNMILTPQQPQEPTEEEDNQEDEVLGVADTYADYVPAKLKIGKSHPDPIVETASLSSVAPPEVYYQLNLPDKLINKGLLSALQLESVVYSCQQHEFILESGERAGYLIGDGAGVGKGRTIAGIIYENYLCGRKKALWVSVSADLKEDSERDLRDIGANFIKVTALNKLKYGKVNRNDLKDGVLFSTYSGLIGESSTGGKFNSRFKQIVDWLGKDFDGLIVFDECHRAKNLCPTGSCKPTKTGLTVQKLQAELKKARVVYASATGASEPKNMAYMTRLGIWGPGTPFREFTDFINAVEKRGIGAMEIVAMDMKLRGAYIARQLSFKGVAFTIEEVPLNEEFEKMYDECVELWVEAMQKFIEAAELMKADNSVKKTMWAQFWASHQRFFKYLCIAAKVDKAVSIAREAVKDGKCVVIGLQSTGEARTAEQKEREGELDDFVSTAKGVFQSLVEKHFPAPDRNKVRRLLGISIFDTLMDDCSNGDPQPGSSSSSGKGKPMRKAAQNAAKRARWNDSDDSANDENDSDFSDHANASSSDSSVTSDSKASDSEFESVSSEMDSDDGALGSRKRKGKAALKMKKKVKGKGKDGPKDVPTKEAVDKACEMRNQLLQKIDKLGGLMPTNTLDYLIDELGGTTDVAEMTGRKMRLVQVECGKVEYQSRAESDVTLDHINLTEKQRFMDGDKHIAIISEAASSGISLQSDRRAKNKRRRVHITLELPWSADRAIQQFGRTHRSNQVNAPEYVFLISDLAGEHRFASIVAKRLESLGALTHGDRRATETRDLSRFHIDNRFGKMALESVMRYIMNGEGSGVPTLPSSDYKGDFRSDVAQGLVGVGLIVNSEENHGNLLPDKDYHNMSKFLNRILGMRVSLQNALFKYFTDTLATIIANAKKQGRFDMGILNLDSNNGKTSLGGTQKFNRKHATGSGIIELHQVVVERGMSWDESEQKYKYLTDKKSEGYYVAKEEKSGKKTAILVVRDEPSSTSTKKDKKSDNDRCYSVYRPSTGLQPRRETLKDITSKYSLSSPEDAKEHWNEQYESSRTRCTHAFWSGKCRNVSVGIDCDIGRRTRTYNVLSGSVLLCWDDVERVLGSRSTQSKIQIVRVQIGDGTKFVGLMIPTDVVEALKKRLRDAEKAEEEKRNEVNGNSSDDDCVMVKC